MRHAKCWIGLLLALSGAGCAKPPLAAEAPPAPSAAREVASQHSERERPEVDFERSPSGARELGASEDERVLRELETAERLLLRFLETAGDDVAYAEAVGKAKLRLQDVRDTMAWLRQGMAEQGKTAPPDAPSP